MSLRWPATLRSDAAGGMTAAVLTVPVSMGLGALAVHGLGERYVAHGMLGGLYAAAVVPVVIVLLGARTSTVYAPRSVVASLIGSLVVQRLLRTDPPLLDLDDVRGTLAVLLFVMLLAGLFQTLFGVLRLGAFVRYIPSPVMAGFQNAAAILILASQIHPMLGLPGGVSLLDAATRLGQAQPLTLLVGLLTALTMSQGHRTRLRIPPVVLGLAAGTGTYYLAAGAGLGGALGPTLGTIPFAVPTSSYLPDFASLLSATVSWKAPLSLVAAGFSLALVASLDALLCVRTVEAITGQRTRGNAELVRLGVGNAVTVCVGGIFSSIHLGGTAAAHRAGARTSASLLVTAGCVLLAIVLFAPALGYLPTAVVAGMLVVIGVQLVDPWTVQTVRRLATGEVVDWRRMTLDLAVTVLVATVAIAIDLFVAVAVGVGVAVLFFLLTMSKSVVRRAYRGDTVHSRKTRSPRLMEVLQAEGGQILVLELEGPIFFGTAEALARRIEVDGVTAAFVVLDLKRVNEIDATGAQILLQLQRRLQGEGKRLALSHVVPGSPIGNIVADTGILRALTRDRVFPDTDRALEWAEEQLIARFLGAREVDDEYELEHLDMLAGLDKGERDVFRAGLVRRTFGSGEMVFREGDEGRDLYIIARGTASVRMRLPGEHRERRLATFAAGTMFGELALLDAGPRSATVQADEDLVCYVLTDEAYATLTRDHHAIAIKLLASLGRELGRRLRRANQTIYQLEA